MFVCIIEAAINNMFIAMIYQSIPRPSLLKQARP